MKYDLNIKLLPGSFRFKFHIYQMNLYINCNLDTNLLEFRKKIKIGGYILP